ncbi:hypothetical protein DRO29_00670 [Candidatus Bathyarchaeota archaeon]|nr:MAG: hypothetical protein DRO29_00670 [Candidatus Bathyarchaeota archaeon]
MSSWKYPFELVLRELDLAKKRKKALDDLYNTGRISQSTYEHIERELTEVMIDLEAHLKSLAEKMKARVKDLEDQMRTLEVFLANLELHYAAGEVDEETYSRQSRAITLGLEATKQEMENIKASLNKIFPEAKAEEKPAETPAEKPAETPAEAPVEASAEAPSEAPSETPAEESAEAPSVASTEEKPAEEERTEQPPPTTPSTFSSGTTWGTL